jgi:hypothetical protein
LDLQKENFNGIFRKISSEDGYPLFVSQQNITKRDAIVLDIPQTQVNYFLSSVIEEASKLVSTHERVAIKCQYTWLYLSNNKIFPENRVATVDYCVYISKTCVGKDNYFINKTCERLSLFITFQDYASLSKLCDYTELCEPLAAFGLDSGIAVFLGVKLFIQVYPSLHSSENYKYIT